MNTIFADRITDAPVHLSMKYSKWHWIPTSFHLQAGCRKEIYSLFRN